MWDFIRWTFWLLIIAIIAAFLHYTLPSNDIVRITDTYDKRVDFGENALFWSHAGTGDAVDKNNRDVFFVQAMTPEEKPMVYRNQDTGWGWPPYFKFDTANLQAIAVDEKSTKEDPQWVAVKNYGWRIPFASIYPNMISVKQVSGPDARVIPWISISILFVLGCIWLAIYSRWRKFWAKRRDPLLDPE